MQTCRPHSDCCGRRELPFQIDNTGDARADLIYTASFGAAVGGVQSVDLTRTVVGSNPTLDVTTNLVSSGVTGINNPVAVFGGGQFQADLFDDPFFFDFQGFQDTLSGTAPGFTGTDAFAGANVSGIVLEIPKADFVGMGTDVGVQAVTEINGVQFDRIGRPAIATVLIPEGRKDEFNQADVAA